MNTKLFLPFALALPMVAVSCDKAADAAGNASDAIENFDPSKLDATALTSKATEAVASLKDGLAGLGDMTDVGKITEKVNGLMGSANILEKIKGNMPEGFKMPAMDGMGDMVKSITEKFTGKAEIMKIVEPLLNKIKGLMG